MIVCPKCEMPVMKIPANWKCPHCSERLPDPTRWQRFTEGFGEYMENKGVIFYSILFLILLIIVIVPDIIFSHGFLLSYILDNMILAMASIFFAGMLITMVMKVMLPLRIMGGGDFIMRERQMIRHFRKWTIIGLIIAVLFCLIVLKPSMFTAYFPSYLIVIGWFLALTWSVLGILMNPQWLEDVRFRAFLEERLGVISLRRFRKLCTIFVGVLMSTLVIYYLLLQVQGIWQSIENSAIIGTVILFIKQYFAWLF